MQKDNNMLKPLFILSGMRGDGVSAIALAYALYLRNNCKEKTNDLKVILNEEPDSSISDFVYNSVGEIWERIASNMDDYENEDLINFILNYSTEPSFGGFEETPESISRLADRILDIKDNEKVADFGSGILSFILKSCACNKNAKYTGIEITPTNVEVSKIRAKLTNYDISIEKGNMFELGYNRSFDKIFSNYPISMRVSKNDREYPFFVDFSEEFSKTDKINTADWFYNRLVMSSLNKNGKAVVIMNPGSVYNTREMDIRKYFINNGFIEAVIALPERLFASTMIPTMLLVLSYGNKGVKFIDAKNHFTNERRRNTLSEKDVENIVIEYYSDEHYVSTAEIAENDYDLNPIIYDGDSPRFENSVKLEEVIEKITRGAHCTSTELDELSTEDDTPFKYLMLASIHDGVIDDELPSLKEMPKKLEKYVVQEGDIVISKNGAPIKVAIAENIGDKKILANGSLYIIRVNQDKVSPYFIKAFLESKVGKKLIAKSVVGNVIPNIPKEKLVKLPIPLFSSEEQKKIIELSQAYSDEIRAYEERLARVRAKIEDLFEEV